MAKIAVVDDIQTQGADLAHMLNRRVRSAGWECIYREPLDDLTEYNTWVLEQGIWALVLDWKLSGTGRSPGKRGVDYTAKEVKEVVRVGYPDFPIYVFTTHKNIAQGEDWLGDVETFESRQDFVRNIDIEASRILRATARFRHSHEETLAMISSLSSKAAQGLLTADEQRKLNAARSSFHLDADLVPERTLRVLDEAEAAQAEINATIEAIRTKMKGV